MGVGATLRASLAERTRVGAGSDLGKGVAEPFDASHVGALTALLDEQAADADGTDREHDDEIDQAATPFSVVSAAPAKGASCCPRGRSRAERASG
ncbi:MAG: hypothetical protein QOG54_1309 [Actinomycetota bacterium]|nr:hypothetical protein [Actinomycetota bacterium]